MRDQDVQNREELEPLPRVAESLQGWVSVHKDTQPSHCLPLWGPGYDRPQQELFLNPSLEFN